jgi:hypothetical protein
MQFAGEAFRQFLLKNLSFQIKQRGKQGHQAESAGFLK